MVKYGLTWWKARVYWRLNLLMDYLLSPSWPNRLVNWIDRDVLHRHLFAEFYDTWTMRLSIIFYERWANLIYGPEEKRQ